MSSRSIGSCCLFVLAIYLLKGVETIVIVLKEARKKRLVSNYINLHAFQVVQQVLCCFNGIRTGNP